MPMKIYTDGFFSIDPIHGFLPIEEPLLRLPERYQPLQHLIDEMPIQKADGQAGLLACENHFEEAARKLPNFKNQVEKEKDPFVCAALFRT